MQVNCTSIHTFMGGFLLAQACHLGAHGQVCFTTPFQYPGGTAITLALYQTAAGMLLSDDAATWAYLGDDAAGNEQAVQSICDEFGVQYGMQGVCLPLTEREVTHGGLPDAVIDLAQACVKISRQCTAGWLLPTGA